VLNHLLLLGLDTVVAHRDALAADDRDTHVMAHAGALFGGQQPPRAVDQDLRRPLWRGRVAGVDDNSAAFQRCSQALPRDQVDRVLRAAPAQNPDVMTARG
jgi:hypothetical protein